MKKNVIVLVGMVLLLLGACSGSTGSTGSGDGGSSTGDSSSDTFTNGGVTLTTAVTTTSDSQTVVVTNSSGTTVLSMVVTTTGLTMSAPGETDQSMTFRTPLSSLPTAYTARSMAIFAAGPMTADTSNFARPDSPGCDWFPDTQCTLGCCADHDACYSANNCGASSWVWGFGTDACKNCNNIAYDCIAAACTGITESFTAENCYDAKCNKKYDCPPDYNSCDCKDICADEGITVPTSCGDGTCVEGENLDNCFNDCGYGTSESECCASRRCSDETGSSCGSCGSPCCCGQDFACDWHVDPTATDNVCVSSFD